jgi:alginate O-acetyltransferase complex protein AlgI
MLFNSYGFIFVFLPITFLGMLWLGKRTQQGAVLWLGLASLVFYAYWNPIFVALLLATIIFNYAVARKLSQLQGRPAPGSTKPLLVTAITLNLLLLGYFKYTNFFVGALADSLGATFQPFHILLPLGISFFTFTQIAFLVDVSRGFAHEHNFARYLLFVTFFPHLIAGPVLHHKQMMPQFSESANFRFQTDNVCVGLSIFVLGLAKKIFIADSFGEIANPIFDAGTATQSLQFFEAWVGALAYTLQLYFDFSAYSDMAIGLSMLFNIRLPLNFNSPFKATSVIDFWQRWHMSLTKYIGEYLYTPISLKLMRRGLGKPFLIETIYTLVLPTLITFFIIGLWHGANYTFIMFGLLHACYLIINHWWRLFKKKFALAKSNSPINRVGSCALTYCCVVIALVFFRADTVATATAICSAMAGLNGISLPATLEPLLTTLSLNTSALGLSFSGVFASKLFTQAHWYIFLLLAIGHLIVWSLPNIHQLMYHYKIACEDLGARPAIKRLEPHGTLRWLVWQPNAVWACMLGGLFFAVVIAMASNKPTSFLYYQF